MINHVWGLLAHPDREWKQIDNERESVSHAYAHHILWLAAIPAVCAFIGTTQLGWSFGGNHLLRLSP